MHPRGMKVSAFLLFLLVWIPSGTYGQGWTPAHATFYTGTDGGACGYGNLVAQGYGTYTTALSGALFNGGVTCGACYQLACHNAPQWCHPGSVTVTATNYCPPNTSLTNGPGWCNPPLQHFDLSEPAFLRIAQYKAGIVPVLYRRVTCVKSGGIRFTVKGNPDFYLVLVTNVGGAGDVRSMSIKGSATGWLQMRRNWGQNWETRVHLVGQSLSFIVTTSDGRSLTIANVVPPSWGFGQTFQARQNF